jgi:hypothetical protein
LPVGRKCDINPLSGIAMQDCPFLGISLILKVVQKKILLNALAGLTMNILPEVPNEYVQSLRSNAQPRHGLVAAARGVDVPSEVSLLGH